MEGTYIELCIYSVGLHGLELELSELKIISARLSRAFYSITVFPGIPLNSDFPHLHTKY